MRRNRDPRFSVPTNGCWTMCMVRGLQLEEIAKRFVEVPDSKKDGSFRSVNLLGVTPLDFGPQENVESLKANPGAVRMEGYLNVGNGR